MEGRRRSRPDLHTRPAGCLNQTLTHRAAHLSLAVGYLMAHATTGYSMICSVQPRSLRRVAAALLSIGLTLPRVSTGAQAPRDVGGAPRQTAPLENLR